MWRTKHPDKENSCHEDFCFIIVLILKEELEKLKEQEWISLEKWAIKVEKNGDER